MESTEKTSTHIEASHRFPKLWMLVTAVVVICSLTAAGIYFNKAYHVKHPVAQPATTKSATTASPTPATAKAQAAQVSQDLKNVDLASIKSSINDLKATLSAFSGQ